MPTLIDQDLYPQDNYEYGQRPKTVSVLTLLMFAACTISYLGAYAAPAALVSAKVLSPWPSYDDPRPKWMVISFICLFGGFVAVTAFFRLLGRLQERRIDQMVEDEK